MGQVFDKCGWHWRGMKGWTYPFLHEVSECNVAGTESRLAGWRQCKADKTMGMQAALVGSRYLLLVEAAQVDY